MLLSTLLGQNSNSALGKTLLFKTSCFDCHEKAWTQHQWQQQQLCLLGLQLSLSSCTVASLYHLVWMKKDHMSMLQQWPVHLFGRNTILIVKWCNYYSLLIYGSRQYPLPPPQWKGFVLWPPSSLAEIPVFELISLHCFKWIWIFETSLHLGVSNHFGGGSMDIFWGCRVKHNWNISCRTLWSSGERANCRKYSGNSI